MTASGWSGRDTPARLGQRLRKLVERIAASLNRMGLPTGQGKTWTAHRVSSLHRVHGIRAYR